MAKTQTYTWQDPNAGNVMRSAQGDNATFVPFDSCVSGQIIRVYDASTLITESCYQAGTLVITPINPAIDPAQQYDCINGGCIPKTTYNTTGKYASLAACQSGCAKDSNCTGECVSVEEIAALQQAASNLQSKNCK